MLITIPSLIRYSEATASTAGVQPAQPRDRVLPGLQPDRGHCPALHERGGRLLVPRLHRGPAHAAKLLLQAARRGPSGSGIL